MKNQRNRILYYVIFLAVILTLSCLFVSAEETEIPENEIEEEELVGVVRIAVSISNTNLSLSRGEAKQLTATNRISSSPIVWSSSDSSRVTVTQNGYIRAIGSTNNSPVTITATLTTPISGYICSASCTVTVSSTPILASGMYVMNSNTSVYYNLYACEESTTPSLNSTVPLHLQLGKRNCLWQINLGSDGYYTIRSLYSAKYLLCQNNAITDGTLIYRATSANTSGSKWAVIKNDNGTYSFVPSACTNQDVQLGVTESDYGESYLTLRTRSSLHLGITEWSLLGMLPTTGDELAFDADAAWSETATNYVYAINYNHLVGHSNLLMPGFTEGEYGDDGLEWYITNESLILAAISLDIEDFEREQGGSYSFYEIGQYEACNEGEYKVALLVGEGGRLWLRQDADGFWSYFDESEGVPKDTDDVNDAIIDPQYACFFDYCTFVGYYAVTPWN